MPLRRHCDQERLGHVGGIQLPSPRCAGQFFCQSRLSGHPASVDSLRCSAIPLVWCALSGTELLWWRRRCQLSCRRCPQKRRRGQEIARWRSKWRVSDSRVRVRPQGRVNWFAWVSVKVVCMRLAGVWDAGIAVGEWLSMLCWCFDCAEGLRRHGERCDRSRCMELVSNFFGKGQTGALRLSLCYLAETMKFLSSQSAEFQ